MRYQFLCSISSILKWQISPRSRFPTENSAGVSKRSGTSLVHRNPQRTGALKTWNRPPFEIGLLALENVNWYEISWFLSKSDHPSSLRMLTVDLKKSLFKVLSVSSMRLVSFAQKASFKLIYTSSESPFFSLSTDVWKYGVMSVFRFFLWVAKFIVDLSNQTLVSNSTCCGIWTVLAHAKLRLFR